jgi:transmembrane sensor
MKTKLPKPHLNRQILDEASAWFVDFRVGDVDAVARERFDQWLRQSPEHIRAYMEIARTYVELPALHPERSINVQDLVAYARSDGNVVTLQPPSPAQSRVAPDSHACATAQRAASTWMRRKWFAVATVMACVIATLSTWVALQSYSTYTTEIGERRAITLADGSIIDLNARSKVRVKLSRAERDVELIDGQALFEVAKDRDRPFIVRSGAAFVRAVGTQFDVYRKKSGTTVTVIEGRVAVNANPSSTRKDASEPPPPGNQDRTDGTATVFLGAGEQVIVTDRTTSTPRRANVSATTAWTEHRLVFDGSRLSDVIEDFNRYNTRQLIIEDRVLDGFHISGVYSSTDSASLVRFLRAQPGIDVVETEREVRIMRK